MRFSTIIAASALVVFAASAQQEQPTNPAVVACRVCIEKAAVSTSPACQSMEPKPLAGGHPTDKQQACYCGLAPNKTWADSCTQSDKCTLEMVQGYYHLFTMLTSSTGLCAGVTSAAAATSVLGGTSKVAAAGAAMAIAGALL
ncbi:hypothetical protein BGW39_006384 [Mortierella sp. 14UC]|nr:hypothetical protein BGW39_006384 [Mortierella sp. 14UC]